MKKIDTLLKKVEVFERLAVYGDRKSFLQALAQDVQTFPPTSSQFINAPYVPGTEPPVSGKNPEEAAAPPAADNTMYMPQDQIKGHRPAQYDARVHAVQSFINKQLVPAGVISPIDEDGKWGTETAKALKLWGDKNNLSGVPLTAVFTAAQTHAATNTI
jgi:hypothetical protein